MSGQPIAATDPVEGGRESPPSQEVGLAAPTIAAPSGPAFTRWLPRFGVWAWSLVGFVVVAIILAVALGAVSEIVLPMTFAAVLAVIFKPMVGSLGRRGVKPTLAAGIVVLGLLLLMTGVVVLTVRGVTDQMSQIGDSVDAAVDTASTSFSIDPAALEQARAAAEQAAPAVEGGFLTHLVSGVSSLIGLAGGLILGAMIMYYLLKDGASLRRSLVARIDPSIRSGVDGFIGDACRILREYGWGRTVMSAIVSVVIGLAALLLGLPLVFTIIVVNFIGGYIPYIGAFLGGGLAVIIALGDGGLGKAAIMLLVVLASNLALENFVEPKVMGRTLDIHPLVVLVVTALGGLLGGIVGLMLAVPFWVIATTGIARLRSAGLVEQAADRAQPALQQLLD
jgi:predicted PurR-regulated permease PerM